MGNRLDGRNIILTGASRGIGQAFAVGMAREGANIVVADLGDASETLTQVDQAGTKGISVQCDVGDEDQVAAMVQQAADALGEITGLVNNAGIYPFGGVEDSSLALWERVMRVNVTGSFLCSRAVIPHMKKAGGGKIVNITSGTFWMGQQGLAAYVTSKGAVVGLTRTSARELGPANIQVNAIAPGLTQTPGVAEGIPDEMTDVTMRFQAIPRKEVPQDMVGAAVFLVSGDSDFMTGQVMAVDGGLIMN